MEAPRVNFTTTRRVGEWSRVFSTPTCTFLLFFLILKICINLTPKKGSETLPSRTIPSGSYPMACTSPFPSFPTEQLSLNRGSMSTAWQSIPLATRFLLIALLAFFCAFFDTFSTGRVRQREHHRKNHRRESCDYASLPVMVPLYSHLLPDCTQNSKGRVPRQAHHQQKRKNSQTRCRWIYSHTRHTRSPEKKGVWKQSRQVSRQVQAHRRCPQLFGNEAHCPGLSLHSLTIFFLQHNKLTSTLYSVWKRPSRLASHSVPWASSTRFSKRPCSSTLKFTWALTTKCASRWCPGPWLR